jgi:UDP-N-acetylglucosamine 2-epimerase (non-hydrolysing)
MSRNLKTKNVLIVIGTRPEAIKMAPIIHVLREKQNFKTIVCATGQHRQMLDQVLNIFKITPNFDLNIMTTNQSLSDITCAVLKKVTKIVEKTSPDIVLVQGDTTTTMATCLAAYYHKITVGHVEAGLRTGNIYSPWPEEINRKIATAIATYHFAPTDRARKNLIDEHVPAEKIFVTGNTVVDALQYVTKKINSDTRLRTQLLSQFSYIDPHKKLILVTGHRRENFGDGFKNICQAIATISKRKDVQIIYPVHLNPNVKIPVESMLSGLPNVNLIDPLDYVPFVYLMSQAYLILTDSGGVQEEAPSLGKPVLVMRNATERPEIIESGAGIVVGTSCEKIVSEVNELLNNQDKHSKMSFIHNPYGDGKASIRIVDKLEEI